ncbi:MAG: FAD-dependent monooxygenase, partial [Rhizobiaceae bacterium]
MASTTPSHDKHCIIIGAGIAGLTAALALEQFGFSVLILEKAAQLEEAGAGIQLSPNATSVLQKLGLLETLLLSATVLQSVDLVAARSGKTLLSLQTNTQSLDHAPFLAVHRADLQATLLQAVQQRTSIDLRLGMTFLTRQLHSDRLEVQFEQDGQRHTVSAACLIGADGVWSTIRQSDGSNLAKFSGYTALRHTLGRTSLVSDILTKTDCVKAFVAPNAHLVSYPISQGQKINLVYIGKDATAAAPSLAGFAPALVRDLAQLQNWTS